MSTDLKRIGVAALAASILVLGGCSAADVASRNLSKEADNFDITRRVVFVNGITDNYLLEIQGLCSIKDQSATRPQLEVTCKVGEDQYKKHFLGLSDNVTYFVEHMEPTDVSTYHYLVRFRPDVVLPDIEIDTEG